MKVLKTIAIIIVILFILAVIGKNDIENNNTNNLKVTIVNNNEDVEILSYKKEGMYIEVIIKNNTGKELDYVRVYAECYDKEGNNIGKYSDMITNINTTDKYKAKILCTSETKDYKLEVQYR